MKQSDKVIYKSLHCFLLYFLTTYTAPQVFKNLINIIEWAKELDTKKGFLRGVKMGFLGGT